MEEFTTVNVLFRRNIEIYLHSILRFALIYNRFLLHLGGAVQPFGVKWCKYKAWYLFNALWVMWDGSIEQFTCGAGIAWDCAKCRYVSLTHLPVPPHICVSIGSDDDLSPSRRQAIIWTNAGILLIAPVGTNFSEIGFKIQSFSFMKMHLKMSFGKWRIFCLGRDELVPL